MKIKNTCIVIGAFTFFLIGWKAIIHQWIHCNHYVSLAEYQSRYKK